jgi:hypothetical protein
LKIIIIDLIEKKNILIFMIKKEINLMKESMKKIKERIIE